MQRYSQINNFLHTSKLFYTIAIGIDSYYTFVSPNYDRNFSLGKKTLLGEHFSVTLHPEDIRICEEVGPRCFAEPEKLFPATLRKHDGKGGFVITQWEMQAMMDESGMPQGIFCIGYNITQFVDTKNKLEQASSDLDEISYIQSHGVRKPLANILGIVELMDTTDGYDDYRHLTAMLKESADELDKIIRYISEKNN
ncbi:PAS domain-containing protein [Mucilaginibacter sp. KACC 22063]|uniref:PAS domain-containing protein n=1 Tax=Mucilaginibacter sp. KACC 22063 TaxID=3025666 RepID=UPI0023673FD1|nr:PAS domain-containing protein [Mucilaginibacter sp. KACC 22063]WDF54177.1 PAS domain-containing protein [Mucilaginibacter sp. KACC 22063]